jgi:Protein of unknown function (DUF1469).
MTPFAVLSGLGVLQQFRATLNGWVRRLTTAGAYGGVAFTLVIAAIVFLGAALFLWLAENMSPPLAALIVAFVLLVLAALAVALARHAVNHGRHDQRSPVPMAGLDTDLAKVLGGANMGLAYAVIAGLIGGLLATQMRSRKSKSD